MKIWITEQHLTTGADGELWNGYIKAIWADCITQEPEPVEIELLNNCNASWHKLGCDGYTYEIKTLWGTLQYCTENDEPLRLIEGV